MTASSMPTLRPLGIGELLDQAIRLYRRNFLNFIGIIAVVQIPLGLLQFGLALIQLQANPALAVTPRGEPTQTQLSPAFWASTGGSFVVALISFVLVQGVATAAMTRAVADNYLGTPTGFTGAYRRIGHAWLPLLGTLFLAALAGILLFVWFLVPCVGWATGLGILAFYSGVIVPMVAPIVVLERKSSYPAMRRAWDLARRRYWPVVGFVTLILLFNLIVISGPNLLISAVFQGLFLRQAANRAALLSAQVIIESLLSLIFSLLYVPLQLIGFTLLYFDLRVRTEGLDLAMLTQDAAAASPDTVLTTQAPPAERGGLITGRELGNFFLLSLGFGAIYAVIVGAVALIIGLLAFAGGA
jgi:hypothetical protein